MFARGFLLFTALNGGFNLANQWWDHNSTAETWTANCGRQASLKALPPSIFAWIWRLRCHKAFPRSHLRLIWLLSMSQCHILIWLLSNRFTGLVGIFATNKCKERSSFLLKRERLVKTDIWGKWSCCSHTVWSCSHVFLFIRSDKKMESSLSILEILLSVSYWREICVVNTIKSLSRRAEGLTSIQCCLAIAWKWCYSFRPISISSTTVEDQHS